MTRAWSAKIGGAASLAKALGRAKKRVGRRITMKVRRLENMRGKESGELLVVSG